MPQPNILMIITDQQRYDSLGCYGNAGVQTPNLDHLAGEGARFERCYCNATICTPSRSSILTGKPLCGHGVYKLHDVLPADQVLLPEHLRRLGYTTALCGKLHVSGRVEEAERRHPNDGFDVYEYCLDPAGLHFDSPLNAYAKWLREKDPRFYDRVLAEGKTLEHFPAELHFSTWAADAAIRFIEGAPEDKPFFCKLSFFDPHDPYLDYPEQAAEMVDESKLPPLQELGEGETDLPVGVRREHERGLHPKGPDAKEKIRAYRLGYHASIAFLDSQIGRVMEAIERRGEAENTIVVFVSDHGDMLGDRGLLTKGGYFYDPSCRVPLLLRYPGKVAAGTVYEQLVQPHDLAATLLGAAGMDAATVTELMPHSMNLFDLLEEGEAVEGYRDYAVTLFRNSGYGLGGTYFDPPLHCSMFHDGRYKLTVYHDAGGDPGAAEREGAPTGELYDMEADAAEINNLWTNPRYAEVKWSLMSRLMDWMVRMEAEYVGSRGGERVTQNVTVV